MHITRKSCFYLILLFLISAGLSAYSSDYDTLKFKSEYLNAKHDTDRVKALNEWSFYEADSKKGIIKASEALNLATKINYKKGEAAALVQLSAHHWALGDFNLALHYATRSIKIKEELDDFSGLPSSYNMLALIYREMGDGEKAIFFLRKALNLLPETAEKKQRYKRAVMYGSLGRSFMMVYQVDSAFYYYQRSYELFDASDNSFQMNLAMTGLGDIQLLKGNREIALGFYRSALNNCVKFPDTSGLTDTYFRLAKYFSVDNNKDSTFFYGQLAISCAIRSNNLIIIKNVARLLYEQCDSLDFKQRLSFLNLSWNALDSLNSKEHFGQIKAMLLNEENRQREKEELKLNEENRKKSEMNYILIAIGIILFIVFISFISNTFYINERTVTFLSILSLLLIFEFLNLVLHSFFADITNHSTLLMLIILVVVAGLLIPLHHRIEKWMIHKLVFKNRKVRLSKARKIIDQLENQSQENEVENKQ